MFSSIWPRSCGLNFISCKLSNESLKWNSSLLNVSTCNCNCLHVKAKRKETSIFVAVQVCWLLWSSDDCRVPSGFVFGRNGITFSNHCHWRHPGQNSGQWKRYSKRDAFWVKQKSYYYVLVIHLSIVSTKPQQFAPRHIFCSHITFQSVTAIDIISVLSFTFVFIAVSVAFLKFFSQIVNIQICACVACKRIGTVLIFCPFAQIYQNSVKHSTQ